ncbi:L-histidine N(alpha)-methyltransferase [Methylovirgula ligni]|uniref:Dimethylhistidine N-methyltransferase n=2 Tax=Methylovirgula ligni TaxID=569860 RepID=A0A3D9Z421_9HYPH|nr:L-histidine N(alpha)-methyltransferase [Methylovirgula ligni]REF88970.1 dimethylhistidine N-methyltransferase [Methylovirgula ligni]
MLQRVDDKTRQHEAFRADVIAGLSQRQKTLPSRWLYDDRGCELFEAITHLDEYYPTRTETAILAENAREIADFCGAQAVVLEYGAGAARKTEILLEALAAPRLYVPIDIAADFVMETSTRVRDRFPGLKVQPIAADFTSDFNIPVTVPARQRVAFFPGSTIGNLNEAETNGFLRRMRHHVGALGRAIIGADLKKDVATLIAAYDDGAGVTARFNLNLLARINRELAGSFRLDQFVHEARWNDAESAIEMHLVSLKRQSATVAGQSFQFRAGETIHTESSRKYTLDGFAKLATNNGWQASKIWADAERRFALFGLSCGGA